MGTSPIAFSSTSLYAIRPIQPRSRSPYQVRGNKVGREKKTLSWHILPLPFILVQPIPAGALPCPQLEPELTRHKELINDTAHPPLSFGRPSSATYNRPPTSPHVRQLILVSPETSLPHWTTPLSLLLRYRPVIVPAEVTATRNHVSPFLQRHRRSVLTILNSQFLLFGSMSVC
ncbi:hypothetical protein HZ326_10026 [Fusarium oxysporum f. sp. albedinis]|nr:hypothetical protein HZ326_10026 [Fusarium oxysporum f. sp. albedinis]